MVGGLLAALFALALLSWTAVADDGATEDAAADGAAGAVDATADDKPVQEPSGGSGVLGASGRLEQPERPSGHAALVSNPLYGTGRLSPVPCPVDEPDVDEAAEMEEFLDAVSDCLDDTWSTQFARAGVPFDPPERVFWSEPGASPCRPYPSSAGAFYCRASMSIYIGTSDVVEKWNGATRSVVYASLLAHEYSHHVQGESGLLEYYHEQREQESDAAGRNAWTRRSELQANCLAGAFLGAVRVTYPLDGGDLDSLLADAAATADREGGPDAERTHGSEDNGVWWTRTGWEEQSPGACNTWDVPDEDLVQ
ncbi:neutral zinc metallopeptidase [Nocardiopsis sp. Huas11]|uniref:neutral zinc metallopeptidase n=1 Tax=Nocardiopsis sp. Huas11 TaxID=2183912 RepID=UPI000EB20463|nr:neutral zinc metallopeptidase [Nocardiopsis sp. Huas11]